MEGYYMSIQDLCSSINSRAEQQNQQAALLREQKRSALMQLKTHPTSPGFVPSGPRKRGEGCDDEDQGIVAADETPTGGARLRVTLLAAGFIIGPGGASIRSISQKSGADIRSWSETFVSPSGKSRRVRTIVTEGSHRSVVMALSILSEAVERYKDLCEGKYCGTAVDRSQFIQGVEFFYSPPPRSAVPYAAALKSDSHSPPSAGASKTISHLSGGPLSPTAALQKENLAAMVAAVNSPTGSQQEAVPTPLGDSPGFTIPAARSQSQLSPLGGLSEVPLVDHSNGIQSLPGVPESLNFAAATGVPAPQSHALAAAMGAPEAQSLFSFSGGTMTPPTPAVLQPYEQFQTPMATTEMNPSIGFAPGAFNLNPSFGAGTQTETAHQPPPPAVPHPSEALEKHHDYPAYSLFGPDSGRFGPHLLNGIWGNDNAAAIGSITGWRGLPAVAVPDDQLTNIGIPSYEHFAEKSPWYVSPSSLGEVTYDPVTGEPSYAIPGVRRAPHPVRKNQAGNLFSAFENNNSNDNDQTMHYEMS